MPPSRSALFCLVLLASATALAMLPPQVAFPQDATDTAANSARVPAVTVAEATEREFLRQVPIAGSLIPRDEVLVYPETAGYRITELTAEIGQRVQKDELLARLERRTLGTQVAQAQAELARAQAGVRQAQSQAASAEATLHQARQALDRARQLNERGTLTQAALEEAEAGERTARAGLQAAQDAVAVSEAQVQQAQAALDLAEVNLENTEVRATVAGVISARSGLVGAIASAAGDPIYRIIRDGLVEVDADVIETDLALISLNDPAELDVAGVGTVPGVVRLVAPTVNAQSRLGSVRITPEQREGLRPGIFVGGWITVNRRRGLGVPASAVITDASGSYVLRVDNGVLERRAVTPGLIWEDQREIVAGLAPRDVVVARAGAFFGQGDVIRPIRENPAAPATAADAGSAGGTGADGSAEDAR